MPKIIREYATELYEIEFLSKSVIGHSVWISIVDSSSYSPSIIYFSTFLKTDDHNLNILKVCNSRPIDKPEYRACINRKQILHPQPDTISIQEK